LGDISAYGPDGILLVTGVVSGTYSATSITGTATIDGNEVSSFNLIMSENSTDGASLDIVMGNYTSVEKATSIAIDADGFISGSDTDGCQYHGSLSIPDVSVNTYKITYELTSCGDLNGNYSGLATYAYLFDEVQQAFIFQTDNQEYSMTNVIFK
jgi:hypothetical protein